MKNKMLLRKTCSIYASDLHFATVIFPFVCKELENNTVIKTILEKDEEENIEKIITNIGLNSEIKEKVKEIDWKESDITKIRKNFKDLEVDLTKKKNIDVIVLGKNIFIQKVNKAIDLWVKNHIQNIEKGNVAINVINCFSFEEKQQVNNILEGHDYILKTIGLEEIESNEDLLKAN